jgi:hypothetical protein
LVSLTIKFIPALYRTQPERKNDGQRFNNFERRNKMKDGCVWIVEQYSLDRWIPRIIDVHSTRAISRNKIKELNKKYHLKEIYFRTRKYVRA